MKLIFTNIDTTEPVTLNEAKAHLGEVWDDQDTMITALITAARERAEEYTNRSIVGKTAVLSLDKLPAHYYVRLPRGPVKEIVSVTYINADNGEQVTMNPTEYTLDRGIEPERLYFNVYPNVKDQINSIEITYKTGYGDITSGEGLNMVVIKKNPLPNTIKQAVLMITRTMYDHREDLVKGTIVARVSQNSEYLLAPYRIFEFL